MFVISRDGDQWCIADGNGKRPLVDSFSFVGEIVPSVSSIILDDSMVLRTGSRSHVGRTPAKDFRPAHVSKQVKGER
jgi:hypothetical protein